VEEVLAFGVPVQVGGTVRDTVVVIGGDLTLLETARIHDLYLLGGALEQHPTARVGGSVTVVSPAVLRAFTTARPGGLVLGAMFLIRLGLFLALGAIAWQLAPTDFAARQMQRVATRPVRVVGLGLLWATLVGTAALVASLTILGLPLGLGFLVFLGAESVVGLTMAFAWIRHPGRLPATGRRIVVASLGFLGLLPVVGESLLYACAAVGLGATLAGLAEARGAQRAALEASRCMSQ
jgi:hypothetical protein